MARRAVALEPPPQRPSADLILDAAEVLFARKGFERTTIKDIGAAAGVNPALIYYYFQDKTTLYHTVLSRLLDSLKGRAGPAVAAARSFEEVIRGVVMAQVTLFSRHPRAASLFIRELLDHDAEHAQALIGALAAELFRPACKVFDAAKRQGTIRPEVDSQYAAISTISQVVYFMLAAPAVRILLQRRDDFPSPADVTEFGRHAAEFAIAALRPAPRRGPTSTKDI